MQGSEQEIIDRYVTSGQVKLVYWPMLDLGPNSRNAAVAAFCAGEQDPVDFWRYHDYLFANQRRVYVANRDFYMDSAAALGLELPTFETCYDSEEMLAQVRQLDEMRRDEGVRQRPTFVIESSDGEREIVLGNQQFELFSEVISSQLAD